MAPPIPATGRPQFPRGARVAPPDWASPKRRLPPHSAEDGWAPRDDELWRCRVSIAPHFIT